MAVDREKVEKEAREILDKFSRALEKVEKEKESEAWIEREEFERGEMSSSDKSDEKSKDAAFAEDGFRKRFLENASEHDDDFVIAEKGEWR